MLRALSQRGCRGGWTVSTFKDWACPASHLEAIHDGVAGFYEDVRKGLPLAQAIAELRAAVAEAQAKLERPSPTSRPSAPQTTAPISATAGRPIAVDWPGLIRRGMATVRGPPVNAPGPSGRGPGGC